MIRVWKLGDHTQQIFPDQKTVDKLTEVLAEAQKKGGDIDIVWDSMISVTVIADDGTVHSDDIQII